VPDGADDHEHAGIVDREVDVAACPAQEQSTNARRTRRGIRNPEHGPGGQIWSPFGASERGIFVFRHHQPISITNSMMLFTGSE
jgi:hypothetical protein